jgi:hypothetical protein
MIELVLSSDRTGCVKEIRDNHGNFQNAYKIEGWKHIAFSSRGNQSERARTRICRIIYLKCSNFLTKDCSESLIHISYYKKCRKIKQNVSASRDTFFIKQKGF